MTTQPLIHIGGNVTGQVAYGQFVYQVQAPGGMVTQITVEEPIRSRPRPVDVRPAPHPAPLGREQEVALLVSESDRIAQIHAGEGWGKSMLLRHLARHPGLEAAQDGVAYLNGWGRPIEDIEQDLFEAFFETALPQMRLQATPGQIRGAMADVEAAVLVDDLDLERRHVERLLDDAPRCRVLLTSHSMTLLDGTDVALVGLDVDSAVLLVTDRLGRDLDDDERQLVREYAAACDGQPLALVLAAAALRRGAMSFGDLSGGTEAVAGALGESLALAERRALGVLKAVAGAPLPADAVGAAAAIDNPQRVLRALQDDGIVQSASPRFRLPTEVAAHLELVDIRAETLTGLTAWAREVSDPALLAQAGRALVEIAEWGRHVPQATVELVRAAHAGLALGGAWGTWGDLLASADGAAGVPFDQAWALHELGTRDLLLGDHANAVVRLRQALDLRSQIDDQSGAAVTRHNLDLLEGPPPGDDGGNRGPNGHFPGRWLAGIVLVVAAVLTGALYATGVIRSDPTSPTTSPSTFSTTSPTTFPTTFSTTPPTTSPTTSPTSGQITAPSTSSAASTVPVTVTPGRLETDIDPVELGEVVVGDVAEESWVVVNRGDEPVNIGNVSVQSPFRVGQSCRTLQAGEECVMVVVFAPGEPGDYGSPLTIEHSGTASPLMVTVLGSAISAPEGLVVASPDSLDFGTVGVDNDREIPVEIRNEGDAPVDTVIPSLTDDEPFSLSGGCPSLGPGESCEIVVSFSPSESGTFTDDLVIEHSGVNDTLEIPVEGEAQVVVQ